MPDFDASRQADLVHLQRKLNDPNIPEHVKKRIQDAVYSIKEQAKFKSIGKMRENLFTAAQRGDKEAADRIAADAKRIDRDWQ
jgi:N-acetylglucosamine kinase-like BadF-type ATPase